jgi:hypothetical protein
MTAGSDIENGCASSLTDTASLSLSRTRSARRVGSESAAKVRSRAASSYLTIKLSIEAALTMSTGEFAGAPPLLLSFG